MSSLFDIGLSGLKASQYALFLSASNIANANNTSYTRREINFMDKNPGLFGNGVNIGDVSRITNLIAEQHVLSTQNSLAKTSTFYENIRNIETYIDNDETSIAKFINESLTALQTVNANPSSFQSRAFYLDQLKNMSNRINDVGSLLEQNTMQSRKSLDQQVTNINQLLQQLQKVNEKIKLQTGTDKFSLQDTQNQLLNDLSQILDFTTQTEDSGAIRLQLTSGFPLLDENYVAKLVANPNRDNDTVIDIGVETSNGIISISSMVQGGHIAGLMDYTNNTLCQLQHKLDLLAVTIAYTINQQNKSGIDTQGNLGTSIFNDPNSPQAMRNRIQAHPMNQGNGDFLIQINQPSQLTESDYQLNFDSPTHYSLTRISDGQLIDQGTISGFPMNLNGEGFSITLNSGTFVAGDTYRINPCKNAASSLHITAPDGTALALGFPVTTSAASQNNGKGQLHLNTVLDTTNTSFSIPKQLNPPLIVEFINATTFRLVNANDNSIVETNIPYDPLQPLSIFPTPGGYDPGYRVDLSGPAEAGDQFFINYNNDGTGDNRNGLALENLYKIGLTGSKQLTFNQAYQDLIFDIASTTNSMKIQLDSDTILNQQAQVQRDEVSAVSLEEETLNLTRMQEFYLANAQVLEVAKQTMDAIFAILRG